MFIWGNRRKLLKSIRHRKKKKQSREKKKGDLNFIRSTLV